MRGGSWDPDSFTGFGQGYICIYSYIYIGYRDITYRGKTLMIREHNDVKRPRISALQDKYNILVPQYLFHHVEVSVYELPAFRSALLEVAPRTHRAFTFIPTSTFLPPCQVYDNDFIDCDKGSVKVLTESQGSICGNTCDKGNCKPSG